MLSSAERAAITAELGWAPGIKPGTELFQANSYNSFTPRIALAWEPLRDQHLYASWARGFKSGGFDGNAASRAAIGDGFRPESGRHL